MKLRYKIISYSSEDPKAPISNLISNSGFWESSRFCEYPQQITIQFYEPVTLSQFSIISHPSKIATKINILFCLPDRTQPNQGYKFNKYGYIQLNNNEATNYRCRQCKRITSVNQNCLFMRLIFWKNHQNSQNFFNQVGLSQINIIGSPYISSTLPALQNKSLLLSLSAAEFVETKVSLLQQFKVQFAKQDDFESAKQIKQIIKVIKLQGDRMKELQVEKKRVVVEEDYGKAKKIKQEIDVIKSDINYLSSNFYDPTKKLIKPVLKDSKLKIKIDELYGRNSLHSSMENSRVSILKKDGFAQQLMEEVKSENQGSEDQDQDDQAMISAKNSRISYDNRVLPAILHKNKKDFKQILKSEENLEDAAYEDNQFIEKYTKKQDDEAPEELNPADQANASNAIEAFGKENIKKIYSKNWNHKLEGINQINEQASTIFNKKQLDKNSYRAGIFVFNKCIKQGSYPILSVTLEMFNNLLVDSQHKDQNAMGELRTELHNELEKSITELFVKMVQNQKVKQSSEGIIKNMVKTELYGGNFLYHTIHKTYNNPTYASSSKIKKYKLGAIETILLENGFGKGGLPKNSIQFVSRVAEDPNGDVRKQATLLLKLMKEKGGGDKVVEIVRNRQSIKGSVVKELEK